MPLAVAMRLELPPGCSRQAAARGTAVGAALTPAMYTLKEEGMLPGACSSMTPVLWSANSSFTPCWAAQKLQPCCVHAWSIRSGAACTHGVLTLSRSCVRRQAIGDACMTPYRNRGLCMHQQRFLHHIPAAQTLLCEGLPALSVRGWALLGSTGSQHSTWCCSHTGVGGAPA